MVKDADDTAYRLAVTDQQIRRFTLDNGMLLACAAEKVCTELSQLFGNTTNLPFAG